MSENFFDRVDAALDDAVDRPAAAFLEPGSRCKPLLNAIGNYISGGELADVSARDLASYHDTGVNWRVTQGYGTLVQTYAAPLDLRFDCPVSLIDHSGARLRIVTPRGEIAARAALVAVPAESILARESVRFHLRRCRPRSATPPPDCRSGSPTSSSCGSSGPTICRPRRGCSARSIR